MVGKDIVGKDNVNDSTFPKSSRLRNSAEFSIVFESGVVCADQTLVVHAADNASESARLGLSISKRVGNAATRNKWKRAIREAFRTQKPAIPDKIDLVIRPRKDAVLDPTAIRNSVVKLSRLAEKRLSKRAKRNKKI